MADIKETKMAIENDLEDLRSIKNSAIASNNFSAQDIRTENFEVYKFQKLLKLYTRLTNELSKDEWKPKKGILNIDGKKSRHAHFEEDKKVVELKQTRESNYDKELPYIISEFIKIRGDYGLDTSILQSTSSAKDNTIKPKFLDEKTADAYFDLIPDEPVNRDAFKIKKEIDYTYSYNRYTGTIPAHRVLIE